MNQSSLVTEPKRDAQCCESERCQKVIYIIMSWRQAIPFTGRKTCIKRYFTYITYNDSYSLYIMCSLPVHMLMSIVNYLLYSTILFFVFVFGPSLASPSTHDRIICKLNPILL